MSQAGKTQARQVAEGPELDNARREVANYKRFRAVVEEIVEVNQQISDLDQWIAGRAGAAPG